MKPISLILSAFGSYSDYTEIDFSNANRGIFLITGDTGSGKTTIFDAITYALYDTTSGGMRNGNMMRSQYAKSDVRTFVEFAFEYKGNVYRIKRNPEYKILKKLKNGKEKEQKVPSAVELTLADGSIFPEKKTETDAKIAEIVGLDEKQFTQIAMIAQGDFLKLLYTKTEERKQIFSKIFQTTLYSGIQENLKRKYQDLSQKLELNTNAMLQEVSKVLWCEDDLMDRLKECQKRVIPPAGEFCEIIGEMIAQGMQEEEQKKTDIEIRSREILKLTSEIAKAEEINKIFFQMRDAKSRLQNVLEAEEPKKLSMDVAVKEREEKMPLLLDQKMAALRALEHIEEVEEKEEKCEKLKSNLINIKNNTVQNQKKLQEYNELHEQSLKQMELLGDYNTQTIKYEEKAKESRQKLQEIHALKDLENKYKKIMQNMENAKNKLLSAEKIAKEAVLRYETDYEMFLNEQAGILASKLVEHMPCPVCGSCEHPHISSQTKGAPSEETIRREKEESEHAKEIREKCRMAFGQVSEQKDALAEQMGQQWERCMDSAWSKISLEECHSAILKQEDELENTLKETLESLSFERKKEEKFNTIKQEEEKRKEEIEKKQQEYEEDTKIISKLETQIAGETQGLLVLKNTLAVTDKEQAEKMKNDAVERLTVLEQNAKQATNVYQSLVEEKNRLNGQISVCKESLHGKTEVKTEEQKEVLQEKEKDQKMEQQNLNELHSRNQANESIRMELMKYHKVREKLESKAIIIENLNKTVNGRINGAAKLDLETYVQRQYFKKIIYQANKRLNTMTCGQFLLKLKENDVAGKGKNEGLDLSVYSLVTDSVRDVKTLSGGEAFMAALSMALGLADIIQRNAGAVHLDMMFIDEGFGSLDDNAREQAIQVLNELAGDSRVVGIISHVTELKDSIEKKLIVKKTKSGSTVSWG